MTTSRTNAFAAVLRHYRTTAGMTQEELAERAKLSVRSVSDLERGVRRIPHKETLALLIDALHLRDEDSARFREAARQSRLAGTDAPAKSVGADLPGGIPASLTPLIGREREGAAIGHLLSRRDIRLVTLTGPAGIGKTRLAQQVAMDLQGAFIDGAVFVSLAPLGDHVLVLPAIAQALGLRVEYSAALHERIQFYLAEREMLLVLDNFEHVLGAVPAIADIAAFCPGVTVLIASRTALRIRGEQEFSVSPLDTPDLDRLPALDDVAHYAAVALFMRRAQAVRPSFKLTPELVPIVAAIVAHLDGLPLAIELAAARIKLMSAEVLLSRLDAGLSILTRGPVDLPERQQTMRGAIAWSYDLLHEPARRLFRGLSVFAGGWTLDAAETVASDGAGSLGDQGPFLLDQLSDLVDQSLVVSGEGTGGAPRFRLLELMREFGRERLVAAGEETEICRRHAEYYVEFAKHADSNLYGIAQAIWFARMEEEHDNLRAALRWALDGGAIEIGLDLAATLKWFWQIRGHVDEGRDWLRRLLALHPAPDGVRHMSLRADALMKAGDLAWFQGDFNSAEKLYNESLDLHRRLGNVSGAAHALNGLGMIAGEQGDFDTSFALQQEALSLFLQVHDTYHMAVVYNNLAVTLCLRQQYAEAVELYEKSLAIYREVGDSRMIADTLYNLGDALREQGELTRAQVLLEQSLALATELKDNREVADILHGLGDVAHDAGDMKRAARLYRESAVAATEVGSRPRLAHLVASSADLACDLGLTGLAVRLFAASRILSETLQVSEPSHYQLRHESKMTAVRKQMDEAAFLAEWEAGRAMALHDVVAMVAALDICVAGLPEGVVSLS